MTTRVRSTLEADFDSQLMATYIEAKRSCRYNATYLLHMLTELGGVETAKRLLASDNPAAGLTTLWECGRLDLSVEAKVLLPEFAELFTEEERAVAKARLQAFGYKLPP